MATTRARVGPSFERRRRTRDGCAVDTFALAGLVGEFVRSWNRTRPPTSEQFGDEGSREQAMTFSAVPWLVEQTHLPSTTIENVLYGHRSRPLTPLSVADALVAAIGRPDAFHDGTLRIVENPTASASARAECCGGSSL